MFYTFLLILLIINSFVLVGSILLQAGKGGGLAASFGGAGSSDAIFGSRQAGNLLTKTSWWSGGIFLVLAFVLSLATTSARTPTSILDSAVPQQPAPVAPPAGEIPGGLPITPAEPPATTPPPQQ